MKKVIIPLVIFIAFFAACNVRNTEPQANVLAKDDQSVQQNQTPVAPPTTVQMLDSVYDFGTVTEGSMVEFSYRFKNTGDKPLIITNAVASCGCTVPEKPEQPVLPGEIGFMKVKFNSENRVGTAHKTVTVTANVEPVFPEILLKGEVIAKK